MARLSPAALLLACACSPRDAALQVPVDGATSLLLARFDPGVEVTAFEPGDEPYVAVPREGYERLYAVYYGCDLASLGMVAGAQDPASSGARLPPSGKVLVAHPQIGELERSAEWPPELEGLRLASRHEDPPPCSHFESTSFELGSEVKGPAMALLPLARDRSLIVSAFGSVLELSAEGLTPKPELSLGPDRILSGFINNAGRVVLTSTPTTYFGDFEQGFGRSVPLGDISSGHAIDGDPNSDLDDLFLLTTRGRLYHFDGRAWSRVDQTADDAPERRISLVWMGPGRAAAVGIAPRLLVTYQDGVLGMRAVPELELGDDLTAVALYQGRDLLVGTRLGHIYLENGGRFESVSSSFSVHVRDAIGLEASVLFGGRAGNFQEYVPGEEDCEPVNLAPSDSIHLARIEHGVSLVSEAMDASAQFAVIAIRTPPPPRRMCVTP